MEVYGMYGELYILSVCVVKMSRSVIGPFEKKNHLLCTKSNSRGKERLRARVFVGKVCQSLYVYEVSKSFTRNEWWI